MLTTVCQIRSSCYCHNKNFAWNELDQLFTLQIIQRIQRVRIQAKDCFRKVFRGRGLPQQIVIPTKRSFRRVVHNDIQVKRFHVMFFTNTPSVENLLKSSSIEVCFHIIKELFPPLCFWYNSKVE